MPLIQIGSEVVDFPNTGRDALWSPPIIRFAQLVGQQLAGILGPFDISPQVLTLDVNQNTYIAPAFSGFPIFPSGSVRKFTFSYAIFRVSDTFSIAEGGTLTGVYNTATVSWELQDEYIGPRQPNGLPYHIFNMVGDNLQLQTIAIPGSYDPINSKISFSARTELVNI